jgi:hypothetical protein
MVLFSEREKTDRREGGGRCKDEFALKLDSANIIDVEEQKEGSSRVIGNLMVKTTVSCSITALVVS